MNIRKNALAWLVVPLILAACADRAPEREEQHDEAHHDSHEEHESEPQRVALSAEAYATAGIAVAPVGIRSVVPTIQVTGTLSYDEGRMAIATARVGGRITRVLADYGQRVAAGDVLAWIDSPQLGAAQAEYRRATSMSRLHRAEYERAQLLLQGQAISRGELLRREAGWRAAQAEFQSAEQQLHLLGLSQGDIEALSDDEDKTGHTYPVRATIGGRVTERKAIQGRVVDSNDELFTVARLESLWLFLQVFEKDLHSVSEGAAVTLTCESHPEDRFSGTIDFVGQVLDPHSRTARARAVIDNPEGELKPGMFVYASIEGRTGDGLSSPRLAVPASATTEMEGRDVVFVRSAAHAFEVRPVVLGRAQGAWVEVRSGLAQGESIAVSGVFALKSEALEGDLVGHAH